MLLWWNTSITWKFTREAYFLEEEEEEEHEKGEKRKEKKKEQFDLEDSSISKVLVGLASNVVYVKLKGKRITTRIIKTYWRKWKKKKEEEKNHDVRNNG